MNRKRIAAGAGLSLGAAFALAAPAHAAADIVVDTTADTAPETLPNNGCEAVGGDECTLREATLKANADPGQDTIVFASGLTGSIDLDDTLGPPWPISFSNFREALHGGDFFIWLKNSAIMTLGAAIAVFSAIAFGVMIVMLFTLPETRGRSLASLEPAPAD